MHAIKKDPNVCKPKLLIAQIQIKKKIKLVTPGHFLTSQHFYIYKEYLCNFGKYRFVAIFVGNTKLAYQASKGFGSD